MSYMSEYSQYDEKRETRKKKSTKLSQRTTNVRHCIENRMCSLNGTKQKGRPNWPCSKVKKSIWRTIDVSELIAVHGASHSNTCGALRALAFNYTFFVSTAADDAIHSYHISIYCLFMFCYFLHFFFSSANESTHNVS